MKTKPVCSLGCLDSVIYFGFPNAMLNYCVLDHCLLHQELTPMEWSTKIEHPIENQSLNLWKWQKSERTVFSYNGKYVTDRDFSNLSMITFCHWSRWFQGSYSFFLCKSVTLENRLVHPYFESCRYCKEDKTCVNSSTAVTFGNGILLFVLALESCATSTAGLNEV